MEPDAVGLRCDLTSCNEVDFLPIKCHCNKVFCRYHISPDKHTCASLDASGPSEEHAPIAKRQRCALGDCKKPSLESVISQEVNLETKPTSSAACTKCLLSFCIDHRHPDLHSCTGLQKQESDEKKDAQHILARHFSNPPSHTPLAVRHTGKPPTDPKKLAQIQKVTLMKMRHSASAGDPRDKSSTVPVNERLHIKARLEVTGMPVQERVLWFRKSVVTGRALDLISANLGVPPSYQTPLCLIKKSVSDPLSCSPLQNDLLLSEQAEDTCTVMLSALPHSRSD
ncbi:uncharacterized protein F5147DRAFT_676934 [Suillus discolor]|uniref:AN1-type domain-containing protein n=1 Tax=Suillus discolor TaxID=1912936 RepID=A0A9P7FG55_9AGAM|nr:uncharacterized protein F5147DRAFT_676934 [Suillus discolor]KAG2115335.1 hypothetical protein F5147DRAFT_676934 [Suillus discolor]